MRDENSLGLYLPFFFFAADVFFFAAGAFFFATGAFFFAAGAFFFAAGAFFFAAGAFFFAVVFFGIKAGILTAITGRSREDTCRRALFLSHLQEYELDMLMFQAIDKPPTTPY